MAKRKVENPELFTPRGCVYRPTVIRRKPDGRRVRSQAWFYWVKYTDGDGLEHRHVLRLGNGMKVTDQSAAEAELRTILKRVQRKAAGIVDRAVESAGMPIRKAIAGYLVYMRGRAGIDPVTGRRNSTQYIVQARRYLLWIALHGGIQRLSDFNKQNIGRALAALADKGKAPGTVNMYRGHAHALGGWAVDVAEILDVNPVDKSLKRDIGGDIRRARRAFTLDEAQRLLAAAPARRRLAYQTSMMTGLRVNEMRRLEWGDCHLDDSAPYLQQRSRAVKNRRSQDGVEAEAIDLNAGLAEAFKAAKPPFARPTDRVFKQIPKLETFKMDLAAAGVPFKDDRGRQLDRHSLRHTFISWLGAAGVDVRVAQGLARHSSVELTTKVYQDRRALAPNVQRAVNALPDVFNLPAVAAAKANGTDGKSVVPSVVPTSGGTTVFVAVSGGIAGNSRHCDNHKDVSEAVSVNACDSKVCASDLSTARETNRAALSIPDHCEVLCPFHCLQATS